MLISRGLQYSRRPVVCQLVRCCSAVASSSSGKHKIPRKRASSLLATLQAEEFVKLKGSREWPEFRSGDSIEIKRLPYITAQEPEVIKGMVLAKNSKKSDTTVMLVNVEYGSTVVRQIKIYNPLIVDVKVLEKNALHKGQKKVKRAKLYYLLDRDPSEYTVK